MVWRLFATKLETAETMEGVALNMRAPYFYPTSTQIISKQDPLSSVGKRDIEPVKKANKAGSMLSIINPYKP
jgi:hypothetical protein